MVDREKSLVGRYIKVLKKCLGGDSSKYEIGDYLLVLRKSGSCYYVEHTGVLALNTPGRNRVVDGDVELMPEGFTPPFTKSPKLSHFPFEGSCFNFTDSLVEYLKESREHAFSLEKGKGIVWNQTQYWFVNENTSKKKYEVSQLLPFITVVLPEHVKDYPLTPKECYNGHIKPGDRVRVENPGDPSHGIVGIVDEIKLNSNKILSIFFKRPLPYHPSGGNLVATPLDKVVLETDNTPEKWCIRIDQYNEDFVDKFLRARKDKWKDYREGWTLSRGSYFHYPPYNPSAHSGGSVEPGYKEVSLGDILHVLTGYTVTNNQITNNLNLEKDEQRDSKIRESIKVCRPNLSIRGECEVRADSARCPKGKIRIGSFDSSDEIGAS